jgi:cellulose synthase/poly-beta-1,6-N-acetylglucosamine synthase-like glycosyltransferase
MLATILSLLLFLACALPALYWLLMALAAIKPARRPAALEREPFLKFALVLPAHDEDTVIEATVKRLLNLDYPPDRFDIHIVADHCTDNTAPIARAAGAIVHERNEGPRSGKGAALTWLFERVLADDQYDAIVIFDADTQVERRFLRVVNARLNQGEQVVQGRHVISNPEQGWFPALTWAMFIIDNRYQNLGRTNLGWSAKHMGDSICFRAGVLKSLGWGQGLTEDFQLRQRLLLQGIKIGYEPYAVGYGEAPLTLAQARVQRMRWLRGTSDSSRQFASQLLTRWLKSGDGSLLDGALQAFLPSFSTLTMVCLLALVLQLLVNWLIAPIFPWSLVWAWAILAGLLFVYPLFGLLLERAPLKAYLVILSGPLFILWRTWLAFRARFLEKRVTWIRTAHGTQK